MAPTPPRTPCNRSQKAILSDTSPSIRGEETSPSQGNASSQSSSGSSQHYSISFQEHSDSFPAVPDQSLSCTHADELSNDPEIQRAQQAIEDLYHRRCPLSDNLTFSLDVESHRQLRRNLEAEGLLQYFDNEIRSDWSPVAGELTLLIMVPTPLHEKTISLLVDAINKELDRLVEDNPVLAQYRKQLTGGGTATVRDSEPVSSGWKSPDFRMDFDNISGAPFVLEVAYSQKPNDLEAKIERYFMETSSVCTVLAIDFVYTAESVEQRPSPTYQHQVKVILWAREESQNGEATIRCHIDDVFRPGGGHRIPPGQVAIPFKFFLPQAKRNNNPAQDAELIFRYKFLADLIKTAEDYDRLESGPEPPRKRGIFNFIRKDGSVKKKVYEPKSKRQKLLANQIIAAQTRSEARKANQ
ncbi:hypothetical protein F4680DRAFT_425515 [Xylaria scruposa]|nr:hypothetical protein F4680DRAFT_425515 [Xylaria scruposa]